MKTILNKLRISTGFATLSAEECAELLRALDEPNPPAGCQCWHDWGDPRAINAICADFYASNHGDCVNCQHNRECHKEAA